MFKTFGEYMYTLLFSPLRRGCRGRRWTTTAVALP